MKYILFAVLLFVSLLVGSLGFSQIVGTIKFLKKFPLKSAVITIIIWVIILGGAYWLAFAFLIKYIWAINIGFVISFLLSLKTRPDNE